jgi:hypothetical protein
MSQKRCGLPACLLSAVPLGQGMYLRMSAPAIFVFHSQVDLITRDLCYPLHTKSLFPGDLQEDQARVRAEGGFVTFRQQASFGLHMLVMMGTFYAMGHVAGGALTGQPAFVGHPAPRSFRCSVQHVGAQHAQKL